MMAFFLPLSQGHESVPVYLSPPSPRMLISTYLNSALGSSWHSQSRRAQGWRSQVMCAKSSSQRYLSVGLWLGGALDVKTF